MLVSALVRGVLVGEKFSKVTLEVTNPLQIIDVRIFPRSDKDKATVQALQASVGKSLPFPLVPEIYNGQVQFQFPFGEEIQFPAAGKSAA